MTRVQLVSKLALRLDVTKKEANLYLTAFLDSIMETLHKDGRVVVQGFGSFKVNEYKARVAKKPLTGELIQLPVRRKPSFHAGKELRQRVNKGMDLVNDSVPAFDDIHASNSRVDFCRDPGLQNPCAASATLWRDRINHDVRVCLVGKGDGNLESPAARVRMDRRREGQRAARV